MGEDGSDYVEDLTVRGVATMDDVTEVLSLGDKNRSGVPHTYRMFIPSLTHSLTHTHIVGWLVVVVDAVCSCFDCDEHALFTQPLAVAAGC